LKDRRIHFIIKSALFLAKVEMRRNIFQWNQKVERGGKGGRNGLFASFLKIWSSAISFYLQIFKIDENFVNVLKIC